MKPIRRMAMLVSLRMAEPSRDSLLASARRVDWRFLLPDPELGHVGYLGPDDPELERACTALARSFERLGPGWKNCDVIVLARPSGDELAAATSAVRPGGWLYVETSGARAWRQAAALDGLRFEDIAVYWHRPSFKSCEEIVPLEDGAVRAMLARRRGFKVLLGGILLRANALRWVISSASVVARRPDGGGS
jgi:hypothetical protein